MKGIIQIFVLVIGISLTSFFWPAWWWIMLIPIVYGTFFKRSVTKAFGLSFLAGLLTWGGSSIYQYYKGSDLITSRVAELFGLPSGLVLVIVIGVLGGITAGIAGATGSSIHRLLTKPKNTYN